MLESSADVAWDHLLSKASHDPSFIAWAVSYYARAHCLSFADIAEHLACTERHLRRICMCRLPSDRSTSFATALAQVARYGQCRTDVLFGIVREAHAVASLAATEQESHSQVLAAARDRKPLPSSPQSEGHE